MDREERFVGKVALVTGAGSGMGRATAVGLAAEGATVVGVDLNGDALAEVASSVSGSGSFHPVVADISDRQQCHAAVATTVADHGGLDVLCNVAGVLRANHTTAVEQSEFDLVIGVNLQGTFWMCQAALPHLEERSGNIVNVASNAGSMGAAYCAVYCASKAAVINLTRSLAMEYAKRNVRVNCVAPGGTNTPMAQQSLFPDDVDWKLIQPVMGFRPMAEPEDISGVILFVASDEGRYMHGALVPVDGGLTAG